MSGLELIYVVPIALGLSADCFAVALSGSIALGNVRLVQVLRTSSSFGLFQALMPLLGWLAGTTIVDVIAAYDHWVALLLLVAVGGRMIWESLHPDDDSIGGTDITRGFALLSLSVATSIDALAIGLSFAFLKTGILLPALVIGTVAFAITSMGFFLGKKVGELAGRRAQAVGGIILIGIGLRILLSHLF